MDGNGQSELIDALTGLRQPDVRARRRSKVDDLTNANAHTHLDAGLGHIPEDRQRRGLVLEFTLAENLVLHDYDKKPYSQVRRAFVCDGSSSKRKKLLERLRRPRRQPGDSVPPRCREGTSRKWSSHGRSRATRSILVAAQPTRGLDVGAIEFVHRQLVAERDTGRGVLLVSLELDEILSLADRILVIYEGRIVGEYSPDVSEEELGIAMTGGGREVAAA